MHDYKTIKTKMSSLYGRLSYPHDNNDHETIEPGYIALFDHGHDELHRIYSDDDTGYIFLEVTTPACNNYDAFEGICTAECTWCDNPYHCKYKNVSRETFMTAHELPLFIISLDICWNCFDGIGCETSCTHDVSTEMTRIAIIMILEGVY